MESLKDLRNHLPTPTRENPHRQLDWIFQDKISLYTNKDSQDNYASALVFYKRFLEQTNNYSETLTKDPRFLLKQEWDVFALQKVKKWIDTRTTPAVKSYLTSSSIIGTLVRFETDNGSRL